MPSWLIGGVLAISFPLIVEAGFRLNAVFADKGDEGDASAGAGHIVSAALGLLGLLIAFTFAMSADRYETRRHLVVEEANAIDVVWLRQQLLEQPERDRLAVLMRQYIKERRAFVAAGSNPKRLGADWARTVALQQKIWDETGVALRTPSAVPFTIVVLEATNNMFDLATSRRAALDAHVPPAILWILIIYGAVTAGVMGYGLAAAGRRHGVASTALFLLVALTIALIVDLDQPRKGLIVVHQAPLDRTASEVMSQPTPR